MKFATAAVFSLAFALVLPAPPVEARPRDHLPSGTTRLRQADAQHAKLLQIFNVTHAATAMAGAWDDDVAAVFDGMARYWTADTRGFWHDLDPQPKPADLLARIAAVREAGGGSTLLSWLEQELRQRAGEGEDPAAMVEVAGAVATNRAVHPYLRLRAADRYRNNARDLDPGRPGHERRSVEMAWMQGLHGCFNEAAFAADEQRLLLTMVYDVHVKGTPPVFRERFVEELDRFGKPADNVWAKHVVRGRVQIDQAWEDRGGGLANTVSDEQWVLFREHLAAAEEELVAAHELRPDFPEAATELIRIAMAEGAAGGQDQRAWLEEALRAQPDHYPAIDNLAWALMPRWGGSHDEMLDLGLELAGRGQHSNYQPLALTNLVGRVVTNLRTQGDPETALAAVRADPALAEALHTLHDGYHAAGIPARPMWHVHSEVALVAYLLGEYELAASLIRNNEVRRATLDDRLRDVIGRPLAVIEAELDELVPAETDAD